MHLFWYYGTGYEEKKIYTAIKQMLSESVKFFSTDPVQREWKWLLFPFSVKSYTVT